MSEYRLEIKVKNNNILKRIEESGYTSVGEFCRLNGKKSWGSRIGSYVNLKESPLNSEGEFYHHVYGMAALLNCSPEDLFTETQMHAAIESNKRTIEVNEAEMRFALDNSNQMLLEDQLFKDELPERVEKLLETLTPNEAKVIKMRFGLENDEAKSLGEMAQHFDVTRERIRQIEMKALRKLRHPSRHGCVLEYVKE